MSKALMFFFAFLIGFVFFQSAIAKDFPMFRGNPQHTGVYDTKGVRDLGGLKWKFQSQGPIRSSPVIANGILYFGSGDNCLYALTVESGKMVWRFEAEGAVQSTPAISDNMVYFAARSGGLYAVDAKSGDLKWKRETTILKKEIYDLYVSSPVISGGLVYFGS